MPNYVRNIIQLSGPLSSMEKLLPHANACIEEGMDIFRLIVSEDTEPRGTWNVQGMDSVSYTHLTLPTKRIV